MNVASLSDARSGRRADFSTFMLTQLVELRLVIIFLTQSYTNNKQIATNSIAYTYNMFAIVEIIVHVTMIRLMTWLYSSCSLVTSW